MRIYLLFTFYKCFQWRKNYTTFIVCFSHTLQVHNKSLRPTGIEVLGFLSGKTSEMKYDTIWRQTIHKRIKRRMEGICIYFNVLKYSTFEIISITWRNSIAAWKFSMNNLLTSFYFPCRILKQGTRFRKENIKSKGKWKHQQRKNASHFTSIAKLSFWAIANFL